MSKHSCAGAGVRTPSLCAHSLWWTLSFGLWFQPVPAHGMALRALGQVVQSVFLHWISWDHGRWEAEASPGAGWADSAMLGLDRCLWGRNTLVWVYEGDSEYHVYFGQGIACFFDMKAELGDKMLHILHQFGVLFPHQFHLIRIHFIRFSPTSSAHPLPAYPCWCCSRSNNQASKQLLPCGSWGIAGSWFVLSHGQPWTPQWPIPASAADLLAPNSHVSWSSVFENYGCFSLSHSC